MGFGECVIKRAGGKSAVHRGVTAVWATVLLVVSLFPLWASDAGAFTAVSQGDHRNVSVVEVSGNYDARNPDGTVNFLSRAEIAKEFYKTHGDDFDFLVIFTNFDFAMIEPGSQAYYSPVKNDIQGIGQALEDKTAFYGSQGKLQGTVDMANLLRHASDPLDPNFEATLYYLTHELMHRWGAMVKFIDSSGNPSTALLGQGGYHWSYLLDSGGSTLYGNHWRDNGDGTFTSIAPEHARKGSAEGRIFSPLELYLMGLIGKNQVPPMLLIDSPTIDATQSPKLGVTIPGTATYVSIDQIIAAEGERIPAVADAQKTFKVGFVYATIPGTWNMRDVIAIDTIRTEWEKRFSILTGGVGLVKTILQVNENVPTNPGVTPSNPTLTDNPDTNIGVSWLAGRQQADGSWQDQAGTAPRDTAAAVAALKTFSGASLNYQQGVSWLGTALPDNTDYLARKVASLGGQGTALAELQGRQNADGGWGSAPGYLSNPTDTALALKALAAAGQSSGATVGNAINYLTSTQKPDGGWSAGAGTSMVQPTAMTLSSFHAYRGSFPLESHIAAGTAWLAAKQNADGGFGNSPSTVYDTAVAITALRQVGTSQAVADAGFNYLLARQGQDGSWNDSTFQTALAVEALWGGRLAADLVVTAADITFNPLVFNTVPADVTVTATVRNLGVESASQVNVAIFRGDPAQGNLVQEKLVDFPGKSTIPVSFVAAIPGYGLHPFTIIVDRAGLILESNEWNNSVTKTFNATQPPPTVGFEADNSNGSEGIGNVQLAVTLSYPWDHPISVNYAVDAVSTASSADYVLSGGTLTFAPGETRKTINITVLNDQLVEGEETIVIALAAPSVGTLGTTKHTYTILDDEPPSVTITSPLGLTIGENTPQLVYVTTGSAAVVKVDGVVVSKVSGDTLGPLPDGPHSVTVEATNALGLTGSARVDFVIDSAVPMVVINAPKGVVNTATPLLDYVVEGAVAVVVKVDDRVVATASGESLAPMAAGAHSLTVVATNALGRSTTVTENFTVDTLPASIDIVSPIPGSIPNSAPLLFYTLSEGVVESIHIDGVQITQRAGENLPSLLDGEHELKIFAVDNFGNKFSSNVAFMVTAHGPIGPRNHGQLPLIETKNELFWPEKTDSGYSQIDNDGFIYLTGSKWYELERNNNVVVRKFDKYGNILWESEIQQPFRQYAYHLEVDGCGNVYVAGETKNTFLDLDGNIYESWDRDIFIARIDKDGVLSWFKSYGGSSNDYINSIALGPNGDAYVSGYHDSSETTNKGFLLRFDKRGDLKFDIHHREYSKYFGSGLAVGGDESIYVFLDNSKILRKINSEGTKIWDVSVSLCKKVRISKDGGVFIISSTDKITKISSNGEIIWESERVKSTNPEGSAGADFDISHFDVSSDNSIYFAGNTNKTHVANDFYDIGFGKIDKHGRLEWVTHNAVPGNEWILGFSLDSEENANIIQNTKYWLEDQKRYQVGFSSIKYGSGKFVSGSTNEKTYYVQSSSGCGQEKIAKLPAVAILNASPGACAGSDTVSKSFSGGPTVMLFAYRNQAGYDKSTFIEGTPTGSLLSYFAGGSSGTGYVELVEVSPAGTVIRVLDSLTVTLKANDISTVGDISSLSGIIQAGNTFGIRLSMSTNSRSLNTIQWGSGAECPLGSQQYFRVKETPVDSGPPVSSISNPLSGEIIRGIYKYIDGTANDSNGTGIKTVEVSVDSGKTWNTATDTSNNNSWENWKFPWILTNSGIFTINSRAIDYFGNIEILQNGFNVSVDNSMPDSDIVPPGLTLSSVVSPTDSSSQIVSGLVEPGAILTVEVNPPSAPLIVPVTNGAWSYLVTGFQAGDNVIRFRAVDPAGNATVKSVTIAYDPLPPFVSQVTPASISSLDQVAITLVASNIKPASGAMVVELVVDYNENHRADAGEPAIRTFRLIDGPPPLSKSNVQRDEDGFENGQIATTLNYQFPYDQWHAPGHYVFRLQSGEETAEVPFQVSEASQLQTIHGVVQGPSGMFLAGAMVEITDKWGRGFGFVRSDANGNFVLNVITPGTYYLIPSSPGYVFDKAKLAPIVVGPSQALTGVVLEMRSGTFQISGRVDDKNYYGFGVPDIWVSAESSQYIGGVLSDINGSYSLQLPAGTFDFKVGNYSVGSASAQGYLGFEGSALTLTVSSASSGNNLLLPKGDRLVCGSVSDAAAFKVAGAPIQAVIPGQTSSPLAGAISDGAGKFCLGLSSGTNWQISLRDGMAQSLGYVGNRLGGISTETGPFDLTVQAVDAWIVGTIRDGNGVAVPKVPIEIANSDGTAHVIGQTASDGTYRLGVFSGNWEVSVLATGLGYNPVSPATVTLSAGQTLSRDFVLTRPQASVTVAPVTTPTNLDYQTLSGTRSDGTTVTLTANTSAVIGQVTYPSSTTWNCTITRLAAGVNNITVTATNASGSTASAQAAITYNPPVVNTIVVTKALYTKRTKILTVEATSGAGANAALQVQGYGAMTWDSKRAVWKLNVTLASAPATVSVIGPEGSKTANVTVK